jgi:hypothetical protein
MGGVARIAVVQTQLFAQVRLTAEDIAENLSAVMDLTHAQVMESTALGSTNA